MQMILVAGGWVHHSLPTNALSRTTSYVYPFTLPLPFPPICFIASAVIPSLSPISSELSDPPGFSVFVSYICLSVHSYVCPFVCLHVCMFVWCFCCFGRWSNYHEASRYKRDRPRLERLQVEAARYLKHAWTKLLWSEDRVPYDKNLVQRVTRESNDRWFCIPLRSFLLIKIHPSNLQQSLARGRNCSIETRVQRTTHDSQRQSEWRSLRKRKFFLLEPDDCRRSGVSSKLRNCRRIRVL